MKEIFILFNNIASKVIKTGILNNKLIFLKLKNFCMFNQIYLKKPFLSIEKSVQSIIQTVNIQNKIKFLMSYQCFPIFAPTIKTLN